MMAERHNNKKTVGQKDRNTDDTGGYEWLWGLQGVTRGTKNTKNVSEKVKYMHFSLNLEKFTPDRKFLHKHRLWCL